MSKRANSWWYGVWAVLALLLLAGKVGTETEAEAPPAQDSFAARVDAYMEARLQELGVPGAAVIVVRGDSVRYAQAYGQADNSGREVTLATPFLADALTGTLTALAVMQQVEAGTINLDAPVRQYLPWFTTEESEAGEQITVRQLLYHTSGLNETEGYARTLDPDGPDALATSVRGLLPARLAGAPGRGFIYSHSNYDLLGLIVAEVTGVDYEAYITKHILQPLAMDNAALTKEGAQAKGASRGYYPFFGVPVVYDRFMPASRATQPSTGLWASATDVGHLLQAHLSAGRFRDTMVLSAAGMETLHTPGVDVGVSAGKAMGWTVFPFEEAAGYRKPAAAPTTLAIGGRWANFRSLAILVPEANAGVAYLMNLNDSLRGSAFDNVGWDLTLMALGVEPTFDTPYEPLLVRLTRPLLAAIVLLLLLSFWWWQRRLRLLRAGAVSRRQTLLLGLLFLAVDMGLAGYALLVRLPAVSTTPRLVLRNTPDLALLAVPFLLLTLGWGTARTLLLLRADRAADASAVRGAG
jgi:CubicO group peptidase (beta-lactamase class C family)